MMLIVFINNLTLNCFIINILSRHMNFIDKPPKPGKKGIKIMQTNKPKSTYLEEQSTN